jgi:hypothetical protein
VDGLEHQRHLAQLAGGNVAEDVAIEVHHAALPAGLGKELGGTFDQAHAGIGDDQLDAAQAAFLEMAQKAAPAGLVLLGALDDAENLAIAVGVDRDRHQQRDVAHFTRPAALGYDAVRYGDSGADGCGLERAAGRVLMA